MTTLRLRWKPTAAKPSSRPYRLPAQTILPPGQTVADSLSWVR